jgi:hypothetical protein
MIILRKNTLRNVQSKKKFVAEVCRSMTAFLAENKSIEVQIRPGVSLRDAGDALRNLAEMLDTAGSVTSNGEEEDPADFWKRQDDDDEEDSV